MREVHEPVVKTTIIAPSEFIGTIMELCQSCRGELGGMDYLSPERGTALHHAVGRDHLSTSSTHWKSRTRGYASLDYEEAGEQEAALVKVDILLQGRGRRRLQRDRAQGLRSGLWPQNDHQAQRAHSPPAVRGAGAGRHRVENHCPRKYPPSAKTFSRSAMAVTSPASASCSRSRKKARSG